MQYCDRRLTPEEIGRLIQDFNTLPFEEFKSLLPTIFKGKENSDFYQGMIAGLNAIAQLTEEFSIINPTGFTRSLAGYAAKILVQKTSQDN